MAMRHKKRFYTCCFASLFACVFSLHAAYAGAIDHLRAHRAVYDLSLIKASERAGFSNMNGRIVYEVRGSTCAGFSVRFRFFTKIQTPRKTLTSDQRSTTYESGDGTHMRFVNKSYFNGQLEKELRGNARLVNNETQVDLILPDEENLHLGPSIFTTFHTAQLIDAAQKAQRFVTARVFDASDEGNELLDTTAIIGKPRNQNNIFKGESADIAKLFQGEKAWPVSLGYFSTEEKTGEGEKLPIYQVSFLIYESGVSRNLKMYYDDYSLKGDLKALEYLPEKPCS